jgi:WD40 repeat protein
VPLVLAPQAAGTTFSVWVARNQITTFDAATGRTLATFSAYDKPEQVTSLAFSVDGGLAAVGLKDGTVRIWDVAKKEKVGADMPAHPGPIADLIFTPDGKTLVTGDGKGDVAIWDLTATPRANKLRFKAHPSALAGFAMSPDGSRFVTFGVDNVVKLWETATAKELRSWDFKLPPLALRPFVRMVVFTPDGKQLATADADTTAYLLDCPSK